jgi:ABC-type polysaccharide/polyol phosphate transport system ATPase subunit
MAHIIFDNVTVKYPVYNAGNLTLKKKLVNISTGGILSKNDNKSVTITALDKVNFSLKDGDSVGLVGHNGAGKTTLLRTIAGIYSPITGNIQRQGKIATIIELGAGLDSELSGYDNIYRLGYLLGMSRAEVSNIIPSIEDFTELGSFLQAPVRTYSSGMLMRLMFAVSTETQPEILLVDEMFGTGDKEFQEKARKRMEDLISSAKIFVFASHSDDLIKKFCNRVFEISHGTVTEIS